MSSPYWSGPDPGQGGREGADRPSWEQPPSAEPTVPLHTQQGWSPSTGSWPGSAATAPLTPYEPDPTPHQGVEPYQPYPLLSYPSQPHPSQGHASPYQPVPSYPAQYQPAQYQPARYHPPTGDPCEPWHAGPLVPVGYPVGGQPVLWSDRSKAAAAVLAFFLGPLGVHNFYLGHVGRGVVQLALTLTGVGLAVTWIWVVVEFVLILTGGLRDRYGRLLR